MNAGVLCAQGDWCTNQSGQPVPAYYNVAIVISQDYRNLYPSEAIARSNAETKIVTAIAALQERLDFFQFDLHINYFFFPNYIDQIYYNSADVGNYIKSVNDIFKVKYPCLNPDCLIILQAGSGHGHGTTLGVDLGAGLLNSPSKVGHELGHTMGLLHCTMPYCNSMMCDFNTNPVKFSSCEINGIKAYVLNDAQCPTFLDFQNPQPPNFTCPVIPVPTVSITSDQPYLLESSKGCTPDRSVATYTVTVSNPSADPITNARLNILYLPNVYDVNLAMTIDFNHDELAISPYRALSRWQNGSQEVFSLDPGESRTLHFKIIYNPDIPLTNSLPTSVKAQLLYGTSGQQVTREYLSKAFKTVNGSGDLFYDTQYPVFVSDNAIISNANNAELGIQSPLILVASGKYIKIGDGETVKTGQGVGVYPVNIEGCNDMWVGITMGSASKLEIDNVTIKDAQKAIEARRGTVLKVTNSRFHNNNYGIFTGGTSTSGAYNITLAGNEFGTSSSGLKPAYGGQSPMPNGNKGFTGIYASMGNTTNMLYPLNVVADPNTGNTNRFFDLKYGIFSTNTMMTVKDAEFTDITAVASGPGYGGPTIAGRAIYATNSTLTVDGTEVGSPRVNFSNCAVGIETQSCVLKAAFTKMDHMGTGISVLSATNRSTNVTSNNIQAKDYGIKVNNVKGLPMNIFNNTLNISDLIVAQPPTKGGVGIDLANSSSNTFFQTLQMSTNNISVVDGIAGIRLRNNNDAWVYNNDAVLTNYALRDNFSVLLESGNGNFLVCNRPNGSGSLANSSGLYVMDADRSTFFCNTTQNTGYGLRFEGLMTGEADVDIATNTMQNNGVGLYYGEGTITGPQTHRGNKWVNTGAQHAGGSIAQQSPYVVDAIENSSFLPNIIFPSDWFINLPDPATTPVCPVNSDCNAMKPNPKEDMDRKIATGKLDAGPYTTATNWLAQRRLYTRLTMEGNPYPANDPDFKAFITMAQQTGLDLYANQQIALKQLFAIGQTDYDLIFNWEKEIDDHLDHLATIDKLLATKGLPKQDSLQYAADRATRSTALSTSETARQNKLTALQNTRLAAIPGLLGNNNALTGTAFYQQYEKTVNEIFLQTIATGLYEFTPAQQATLETIALQCPLSRGEAVLRARALLALVQDIPVDYDNIVPCLPANRESGYVTNTNELRIYPNPAKDVLTIEYPGAEPAELRLFNALGQQVMQVKLVGQEIRQLDLSALQSGIYWYVLQSDSEPALSGKVLISK